jgi:hypothetical protein
LIGEAGIFFGFAGVLEAGGANDDFVGEGAFSGLLTGIDGVSNGTALHKDDGMVPVLAGDGGGETEDEFGLGPADREFETLRREMVAFIDDDVSVVGDEVFDDALTDEALDHDDVDLSGEFFASASKASDVFFIEIEELGEPFDPLIHELLAMNEDEGVDSALCDEPGCQNGFSEGGGGGKDTGFVGEQCFSGGFLLGVEGALESCFNGLAGVALVVDLGFDFQLLEECEDFSETATWEGEVERVVFGAGDDTRFVVGGEAHRLRFVEVGILECCEPG